MSLLEQYKGAPSLAGFEEWRDRIHAPTNGHFNCAGDKYITPRKSCEFIQAGINCCLMQGHDGECCFLEVPYAAQPAPNSKLPDSDGDPVTAMSRDVLRTQSELISKYAAHCEAKALTCSSMATLLDYNARAKLARDISLIYFRAATLEV